MNFLAHACLSFNHPQVLIGNMISDFVKGKNQYDYPPLIQSGISLHRNIDAFTDTHEATKIGKEIFRTDYRLYSGAIMDIVYDFFLANDKTLFDDQSLMKFTQSVYEVLEKNSFHLPPAFLVMLSYMKKEDWLYHYKTNMGIQKSLRGLVRRSAFLSDHSKAYELFIKYNKELGDCYDIFFTDVKTFAKRQFDSLIM
ncbi:MAG TPA: ACP phosphodiesterase [Chitinophagaceae bacterium]|nr:ACP phosphodiesterase [Chitinophagaceae bacterium]